MNASVSLSARSAKGYTFQPLSKASPRPMLLCVSGSHVVELLFRCCQNGARLKGTHVCAQPHPLSYHPRPRISIHAEFSSTVLPEAGTEDEQWSVKVEQQFQTSRQCSTIGLLRTLKAVRVEIKTGSKGLQCLPFCDEHDLFLSTF